MKQRALFLDRDGTLVHAYHYPSLPEHLRVYAGIGPSLFQLQQAGFRLIVITNQSGIARGYFDEAALHLMHEHVRAELARFDVQIDGIYYCPHHPEGTIAELAVVCDCRKPQPGMLLRAAAEHNLDLHRSWFVGDILDDVEAGNRAECRTVLVDLGTESAPTLEIRMPRLVARDTAHALAAICGYEGLSAIPDDYLPPSWHATSQSELVMP